jgi:hypothetical protein
MAIERPTSGEVGSRAISDYCGSANGWGAGLSNRPDGIENARGPDRVDVIRAGTQGCQLRDGAI